MRFLHTNSPKRVLLYSLLSSLLITGCGRKEPHHDDVTAPPADDGDHSDDADKPAAKPLPVADDRPVNDETADFKGYLAVESHIKDRLMMTSSNFSLSSYLDSYVSNTVEGLGQLLGYQVGEGLQAEFRNGKANAINMVLWHMALGNVAADIATYCQAGTPSYRVALNPEVEAQVKRICPWPAADARSDAALQGLWNSVMVAEAPPSESKAFKDFFDGPAFAKATGSEVVEAMLTAMFYNPHFLVRK